MMGLVTLVTLLFILRDDFGEQLSQDEGIFQRMSTQKRFREMGKRYTQKDKY